MRGGDVHMKVKTFIIGCLTGMFVALLIYAPISQTQTEKQYDPWADMNDDGKIDVKDIYYLASIYGTTGDPTKNVNVTNWPALLTVETKLAHKEWWGYIEVKAHNYTYIWFNIEGYRQVSIGYIFPNTPFDKYPLWIKMGRLEATWPGGAYYTTFFKTINQPNHGNYYCETFLVQGPHLGINVWNLSNSTVQVSIGIYITA